jgi:ribonucleoside-triphosphate reductase (thioredoxin)
MKLPTPYQEYIHKSRYARYRDDLGRRENWDETVDRYIDFFKGRVTSNKVPWSELREAIVNLDVMPSMRCLMTAGPALERDHVAGYNCSYVPVDHPRVFDEIMYILLCGTGVGFSVERQYINKLPEVAEEFNDVETEIHVRDSKIGWASALRQLVALLYQGNIPRWNLDRIRPAGARLKTFGGRASGPEPLDELFRYTVRAFQQAAGRRLNSLEVHDLVCKVASAVVCGGVRRSALISLSNLTDERMRKAKSGEWYHAHPHRALANNSVAYTERPDMGVFMREWQSLYESKSGERGIFARYASGAMVPERRDPEWEFGTNPCSEIVLRPKQFCNLTEVVVRPTDTEADIKRKVELATILGTVQATLTDFRYLSSAWRKNTEEERLLGVSLTGILDREDGIWGVPLTDMKAIAIETNKKFAKVLGIPASAAITCVKPSGTVSQLVDSASGMHPRYAPYYIRRVRGDKHDPLCQALIDAGVPYETDVHNPSAWVFSFPMKAPVGALTVRDVGAIEQLEQWRWLQDYWCEHKPSVSIYVREHEWLEVGAWVYENFDTMSGVSFFPYDDHVYQQAPYEPVSKEKYEELLAKMPSDIDLNVSEADDTTTASQEMACVGGACEL